MSDHPIVVVGAGLSGLHASRLLQRRGRRVLLLDARPRVGGRIVSQGPPGVEHRVDLGPAWFWPQLNPRTARLLDGLGLAHHPQHADGAIAFETADGRVHRQRAGWAQEPASRRIAGGTQRLVEALHDALRRDGGVDVRLDTRVLGATLRGDGDGDGDGGGIELHVEHAQRRGALTASQVIFALPPRLLARDVAFAPAWPAPLVERLRASATWMAGQAKFAAVYPRAFWREQGRSGAAFSQRGPLVEVHDASDADGRVGALFGFVGVGAEGRARLGREELGRLALAQLVRLFGPEAAEPAWTALHDWAQETWTAAPEDRLAPPRHVGGDAVDVPVPWRGRVALAGAERSVDFGGYLEGALDAAEAAVESLSSTDDAGRAGQPASHRAPA